MSIDHRLATSPGAWNKLALLHQQMRSELQSAELDSRSPTFAWILWADWDALITDVGFELPLEEYEERGIRLVVGGDADGVYRRADYEKLNTGVMLLRVHKWSLALLAALLAQGHRAVRARHAVRIQSVVQHLCRGCFDDQAALVGILYQNPARWKAHTWIERRFLMQGYWEDFATAIPLPENDEKVEKTAVGDTHRAEGGGVHTSDDAPRVPRVPGLPGSTALRIPVWGITRVPFIVHFAGCQLCSGKAASDKTALCAPAFRRTLHFAEAQAARD